MENYSALKRNESLACTITWMNLEDSVLSEIRQSPKDTYCMIPLCKVPRVIIFVKTESRIMSAKGWGGAMGSIVLPLSVQFLKLEKHQP